MAKHRSYSVEFSNGSLRMMAMIRCICSGTGTEVEDGGSPSHGAAPTATIPYPSAGTSEAHEPSVLPAVVDRIGCFDNPCIP